jgi:hypothetical protein
MRYDVQVDWDDEAKMWFVSESNVPGLVTEAPTLEVMLAKLEVMVPEMLEENGFHVGSNVPFFLLTQRQGHARRSH